MMNVRVHDMPLHALFAATKQLYAVPPYLLALVLPFLLRNA